MIKHISSKEEFENTIKEGVYLVDFFATWCGPCRMLTPVLEEVSEEDLIEATILKIDVDEVSDVPARYGVQYIPTMVLIKDGKTVDIHTGFLSKDAIVEFVKKAY